MNPENMPSDIAKIEINVFCAGHLSQGLRFVAWTTWHSKRIGCTVRTRSPRLALAFVPQPGPPFESGEFHRLMLYGLLGS
jgi:hypothetical protein